MVHLLATAITSALGMSLNMVQTVGIFHPSLLVEIWRYSYPIYAVQATVLILVLICFALALRRTAQAKSEGLRLPERFEKCMRLPRAALRGAILGSLIGVLPVMRTSIVGWPQGPPFTDETGTVSYLMSPIYVGLVILLFGVVQYYLMQFIASGAVDHRR